MTKTDEEIAAKLPDGVIRSEYQRRFGAHRPRKERPCPKCGKLFSARETRAHVPRCQAPTVEPTPATR